MNNTSFLLLFFLFSSSRHPTTFISFVSTIDAIRHSSVFHRRNPFYEFFFLFTWNTNMYIEYTQHWQYGEVCARYSRETCIHIPTNNRPRFLPSFLLSPLGLHAYTHSPTHTFVSFFWICARLHVWFDRTYPFMVFTSLQCSWQSAARQTSINQLSLTLCNSIYKRHLFIYFFFVR